MRTLDACGVAGAMRATGRISSYGEMQVWDALGPAHITFTAQDATDAAALSLAADGGAGRLGYIAENGVLNGALFDELQRLHAGGQLELVCPAKVKGIDVPGAGSAAQMLPEAAGSQPPASADRLASVTLEDGRVLRARLLVAADGAASAVRGAAHIGTWGWSYDQHGVVATVKTDGHGDTAWQRFLPHGPVAILPVSRAACGIGQCSSAVCVLRLKREPHPSSAKASE
jgi:2-polyprenyl-6-methoxyphenol hydroxylase-like FAD-dependent oxidoreductase